MLEREEAYHQIAHKKDTIIDAHTHAGFDATNVVRKRYSTSQSVMDFVRKMKSNGVDYSAVFPPPDFSI